MSVRCSVFCGVSLDGFLARLDHSMDWLPGANPDEGAPPPDAGYDDFIATIDCVVMGRNTFDVVLKMFKDRWYYTKPVYVLTGRALDVPSHLRGKVEFGSQTPRALVDLMEKRGARRLYIDGGKTIQAFLRAGLIDDLTLTQIPVLIGQGVPVFGPLDKDVHLELQSSKTIGGGAVQSVYRVKRA